MKEEKPEFYSPPASISLTLLMYFGAQFVAGVLVSIIPAIRGWSIAQTNDWLQNNVFGTFAFLLIIQITTIVLVRTFLKLRDKGFGFLGLNKPNLKHVVSALGGYGVYFVLYLVGIVLAKAFIPSLDLEKEQELGFSTSTSGWPLLVVFISLVILPPLIEEIVARGFLYSGLRTKLTFGVSAIITSLLFAAAHLNGARDGLLWVAAIDTFILSMVLCYLREKTGSLWPPIGVHMLKNGVAFVVLFNIVSYIR